MLAFTRLVWHDSVMVLTEDDKHSIRTLIQEETNPQFAELTKQLSVATNQILRAFQMTEENIRQDAAHVDEVQELRSRIERLEKQAGIVR